MSTEIDRKLIVQIAAVLLILPMLYVASSGPLLSYAKRRGRRDA